MAFPNLSTHCTVIWILIFPRVMQIISMRGGVPITLPVLEPTRPADDENASCSLERVIMYFYVVVFFFFFLNTGNTDWLCCLAKRQRKINSLPVPLLLTQASGMYEDWINEHYMQHSPTAHHWFELIKTSLWESVVSLKWSQLASVN